MALQKSESLPRCYLDFTQVPDHYLGRVIVELFADVVPKTSENFRCLCTGEKRLNAKTKLYYKKCQVHRVIPDFMIQTGDFTNGDGTGGLSIYGRKFEDENLQLKHSKYALSMANAGPNSNASQFFICTSDCDHLNGKHVVFGRCVDGLDVIDRIEQCKTDSSNDRPLTPIFISKCGQLKLVRQPSNTDDDGAASAFKPDNVIDVDAEETVMVVDEDAQNNIPKTTVSDHEDKPALESDSQSPSESASDVSDAEHKDNDDDVEEEEDVDDERERRRQQNKEFHLNSVKFMDRRSGRMVKGKGNFKYFARNTNDSVNVHDRTEHDRRSQRHRETRFREHDFEREREQRLRTEQERKRLRENAELRMSNANMLCIDHDTHAVSSVVSRFDRQVKTRSNSRSRSRERADGAAHH